MRSIGISKRAVSRSRRIGQAIQQAAEAVDVLGEEAVVLQQQLHPRVIEIGVSGGGKLGHFLGPQLWHPVGIVGVQPITEIDKGTKVGLAGYRSDD